MIRNCLTYIRPVFHLCSFCVLCVFLWATTSAADTGETKAKTQSMAAAGTERAQPKKPSQRAVLQPISPAHALPAPSLRPVSATGGLECLIEPYMTVDVATSATGVVKQVYVDRGHIVKSGQVLARLEAEIEKANVAQARARVEFSSRKYGRTRELFKEQIVSEEDLDESKSEDALAQAELQKATELLNQRKIVSPLAGVVVERYVSPGEFVESKKIVKVAQIHPLNVEVIAPVSMLGEFKVGAKVMVFPEGPVSGPLEARVKLVDRVIDASSGTFRVRLDLPNPKFKISAGVRCQASLDDPSVPARPR